MRFHPQYPKFRLDYARPIRRRWVEGLRSGKYEQGIDCLVDAQGRCCPLGVLCMEFYDMYPGRVKKEKDELGRTTFDGNAFIVPLLIAELVGLTDREGWFKDRTGKFEPLYDSLPYPGIVSVSVVNDRGLVTFEDIAAVVEDRTSHIFVES